MKCEIIPALGVVHRGSGSGFKRGWVTPGRWSTSAQKCKNVSNPGSSRELDDSLSLSNLPSDLCKTDFYAGA